MRKFLTRNISVWGRLVRTLWGVALIVLALWLSGSGLAIRLFLFAAGGFALFEAVRGWCLLRACGIRTKL